MHVVVYPRPPKYLEKRGVPTSTIVSTAFHRHGRLAAKNLRIDALL
jgi:hypothetical protein